MAHQYRAGEKVIYRKQKASTHPGPRAHDISPAPQGEDYRYFVDKFWTVVEVREDGKVVVSTRRGKQHVLSPKDEHLRPAHWWERLLYARRFPRPPVQPQEKSRDGELSDAHS